jgi:type I restriction enzyme S subunit
VSYYKPYPAYKDSGVEWLGRVPDHWVTKKLLYWISGYGSGTTPSSEDEYSTDGHPWVTTGELRENTVFSTEKRVTQDALKNNSALKLHPAGSLVIAMYGATVGRLGVLGIDATLNQACFAIHPSERIRIPFLRNWFEGFRSELVGLATGAGQPNISGDKIRNLLLPCPPDLSEQAAIIAHLDRETARIDALIEKKTRFIELLREKRQALITHAVTKGLDPTVKMKDSGVEWLGEVPEHWEMVPLKYVTPSLTVGIVVNPSDYVADEGLPFLYGGDIGEGVIFAESARRISPEHSQRNAKTRLNAGDLVTVRVGAPGVTAVVPPECEGGNCASVMLIRRGEFNSDWLCYTMNSRVVRYQVEVVQYGAAQEQFNISHAVDFLIPVPPVEEQSQIASVLNQEGGRVDALLSKTERSIELLKERRSALITAAVTGQIDLREAV